MVKDGRDSIKRSMPPCFHNGPPPQECYSKEKRKKNFQEKEEKVFMKNRIIMTFGILFEINSF